MRLTEREYKQYLRIHPRLIYYVGLQEKLISRTVSFETFRDFSAQEKISSRDMVYKKPKYIDEFVKENPYNLSEEDIEIAKGFKNFQQGKYWVIKFLKKYTIFLDKNYAYGVLALSDPLDWLLGNNLPTMLETVLLPFKGRIIYDGFIRGYNVSFGRGINSSLTNEYNEAKAKYGIITSLPIDKEVKEVEFTDADRLELYMKTATSREQYWYDIQDLLYKSPKLMSLYNELWGKINSRAKKKSLKEMGIKGYYFGIYNDVIIASSKTKTGLESQLKQMLKKEELASIHIFKI